MTDFEHIDYESGEEDFDGANENGEENEVGDENEVGIPRHSTKSDTLAELRMKELGKKHEVTKIDYTSNLRKTSSNPQSTPREKKTSTDCPNYLNQLKKTDTGVATQPEYVRLAKRSESGGKHVEKKYTAEELMSMAFKKADDADQRDPAVRRGIVQSKSTVQPGTFQGIKQTNGVKEDYMAVLKQHVSVEPKFPHKSTDDKPTWANVSPRRVIEADIKTRNRDKQEKPEWAQLGRGAKKHVPELQQGKPAEKSQTPEWASLVNKTDRKRLIELEQKKTRGRNENDQPEWAGKSRDPREILKVEHKVTRKTSDNDSPDYKGMLRNGSRKESIKFGELQRALGEEDSSSDVTGWRLVDRLRITKEGDQSDDVDNETNEDRDHVFDENLNNVQTRPLENGEKQMTNGSGGSEESQRKVRRKSSSFQAQNRKKSSTARFSLAQSLPAATKREISDVLMDWADEIMTEYEDREVKDLSSTWDDGIAFCNIMHYYEDDKIPLHKLNAAAKRSNLMIAFQVASDAGIPTPISVDDFMKSKVPDANKVFDILHEIYSHYHGPLVERGPIS